MLDRVLFVASVKFLCCHNAIPHRLKSELTSDNFQLNISRLNLQQTLSFNSSLQNKLVLTLTVDIIIQSEPEKQEKNEIWDKNFNDVSDFELKFYNALDFELEILLRVRF